MNRSGRLSESELVRNEVFRVSSSVFRVEGNRILHEATEIAEEAESLRVSGSVFRIRGLRNDNQIRAFLETQFLCSYAVILHRNE